MLPLSTQVLVRDHRSVQLSARKAVAENQSARHLAEPLGRQPYLRCRMPKLLSLRWLMVYFHANLYKFLTRVFQSEARKCVFTGSQSNRSRPSPPQTPQNNQHKKTRDAHCPFPYSPLSPLLEDPLETLSNLKADPRPAHHISNLA